jgi:hypothetical protein
MKSPDLAQLLRRQGDADAGPDPAAERRLATAVRDAFAAPCPDLLAGRILAAVRDEERALRAWPATWLFVLPVIEVMLLLLLRSDLAAALTLATGTWTTVREAALPSWQTAAEAAQSWWLAGSTWLGSDVPLQVERLQWVAALLLVVTVAGALILRQEERHA